MESSTTTVTTTQPAKFTRYRSVRRATTPKAPEDAPPVPHVADLNRTPSRYRRPSRPTLPTSPPLPKLDTVPGIPIPAQQLYSPTFQDHQAPEIHAESPVARSAKVTSQGQAPPGSDGGGVEGSTLPQRTSRNTTERRERILDRTASSAIRPTAGIHRSYEAAREEARMILEGEFDRLQRFKETQKYGEQNQRSTVSSQKLRPRASTVNDKLVPASHPGTARYDLGKFVDAPKQAYVRRIPAPSTTTPVPHQIIPDQVFKPRPGDTQIRTENSASQPVFDAPVSAVNTGDRRVEVRYNGTSSSITLPVTPSTTACDLLNSASVCMSESFDPRTAVLVESFSSAGLERPLRRYEHVRDVMNSWNTDTQNHLVVMSDGDCATAGLERKEAPLSQPADTMVRMSVSHMPGRWDKKWLVLRSDGQITASKHENDGEASNICHLSDFDVYTPTRKQVKKIKTSKKICFAIKSLQKSAIFLESTNFIHFFATNDKQVADQWYQAVQSWRSWYLVHVMGEGMQPRKSQEVSGPDEGASARLTSSQSQEIIPYQLGSFQPLLELNSLRFGHPLYCGNSGTVHQIQLADDSGKGRQSMELRNSIDVVDGRTRHGSRQTRAPPPAVSNKLLTEVRNKVDLGLDTDDQAFTGTGLLARSASKRAQGGKGTGHGVLGVKGRPLVDLQEQSEFADGSLLRQLEAWTASHGEQDPKHRIDRQRRVEADVRVGEGL